jgi:hypothetical protein
MQQSHHAQRGDQEKGHFSWQSSALSVKSRLAGELFANAVQRGHHAEHGDQEKGHGD